MRRWIGRGMVAAGIAAVALTPLGAASAQAAAPAAEPTIACQPHQGAYATNATTVPAFDDNLQPAGGVGGEFCSSLKMDASGTTYVSVDVYGTWVRLSDVHGI